jgi:hypothetical protein
VVLAGGGDAGSEMAVAPGGGPSLFSPLFSFSSSLFFSCPFPLSFFLLVFSSLFFVSSPFASSLPLYL